MDKNKNLFRQEALHYNLQSEEGRGIIQISPPWTWALLSVIITASCAGFLISLFGEIEVNGRGRGILKPMSGIRMLASQISGTIGAINTYSGQRVYKNDLLIQINAPNIQIDLLTAEHQIGVIQNDYKKITVMQENAYQEQVKRLQSRIEQLNELLVSQKRSIQTSEKHLKTALLLQKKEFVSMDQVDAAQEELASMQRQAGSIQQSIDQAKQEQAALESRRQDEIWQSKQIIQNALVKRDALSYSKEQTEIRAPENGIVEAMLVNQGEVVQSGQILGKLIPTNTPLQVVSFLQEKDRAFVKPGSEVKLELDQLPYSEYGTLCAKVIRISEDLASPFEIQEALGIDQRLEYPSFRVELEILNQHAAQAAQVRLRSGMLLNVRYTLKKQRLLTLVIKPLRKWFS